MSNVVVFQDNARPSYALAKTEASSLTKSLAGSGGFPGKRVSIKGGVFRLIADGKQVASIEDRHLDVVIVRAAEHIGRTFYSQGFDEDKPAAPDCWSADGTKPDVTASNPQCDNCAQCPQNVKGSGKDDSRACRFSQRVAVVLANDVEGDVLQLSLPAGSIFGKEEGDNRPLQAYARYLAANKADVEQFITRLKFDLTASNPKLFFKPMRWLTDEEYAVTVAKGLTDDAVRAVTMSVAQTDKVTQPALAVPGKAPKAATKPAAEPEPAGDDEPPAPAPTVGKAKTTKGKPAAKAAASTDDDPPAPEPTLKAAKPGAPEIPARTAVSQVAAQWDTDD